MRQFWTNCAYCEQRRATATMMSADPFTVLCCSKKCCDAYLARHSPDTIRMPKAPTVRASRKQERKVALEMGGRQIPGSGAVPGIDGDVVSATEFIECKTTGARQITLKLADWEKTLVEATRSGKPPSMRLQFNHTGSIVPAYDLVVLDKDYYMTLMEEAGRL